MTPTKLLRDVYLLTASGSAWIASQAAATPGEYAKAKSSPLDKGFVGVTEIFPGRGYW
jgi:hypothetical protein